MENIDSVFARFEARNANAVAKPAKPKPMRPMDLDSKYHGSLAGFMAPVCGNSESAYGRSPKIGFTVH